MGIGPPLSTGVRKTIAIRACGLFGGRLCRLVGRARGRIHQSRRVGTPGGTRLRRRRFARIVARVPGAPHNEPTVRFVNVCTATKVDRAMLMP